MLSIWFYSLTSVGVTSLISLIGVVSLVSSKSVLEKFLFFMVAFAAGGLLGDAFIHLLPEAFDQVDPTLVSLAVLLGILIFFVLEKFIAWRHCHIPTSETHPHPLVFMNLIGDGVHNFLDGAIIASSFLVSFPLGMATSLAVFFHEIPQEIGDFSILLHGGFSPKRALIFNFVLSLLALFGAVFVLLLGVGFLPVAGFLLPLTAGGFIYIASSDLIPQLHKETRPARSLAQLAGLLLGIGVMIVLKIWS